MSEHPVPPGPSGCCCQLALVLVLSIAAWTVVGVAVALGWRLLT